MKQFLVLLVFTLGKEYQHYILQKQTKEMERLTGISSDENIVMMITSAPMLCQCVSISTHPILYLSRNMCALLA